jgi:hypothetical protein
VKGVFTRNGQPVFVGIKQQPGPKYISPDMGSGKGTITGSGKADANQVAVWKGADSPKEVN